MSRTWHDDPPVNLRWMDNLHTLWFVGLVLAALVGAVFGHIGCSMAPEINSFTMLSGGGIGALIYMICSGCITAGASGSITRSAGDAPSSSP